MFEELYAPLSDTSKVLDRIGLSDYRPILNLESLNRLIYAFKTHIPFENLTVWLERKTPSLAPADLYNKMILHKRGGYCFEMNGFFNAFLSALGFDVYSVSVYVRENLDSLPDLGHRSNICILDGRKYFVEVGYGGSSPDCAVPLDGEAAGGFFIQEENRELTVYKIVDRESEVAKGFGHFLEYRQISEDQFVTCKKTETFRDYVAYPVEFVLPNIAVSLDHNNKFNQNLIVNFANENGDIYSIVNDHFKAKTSEGETTRIIHNLSELKEILLDYFEIEL